MLLHMLFSVLNIKSFELGMHNICTTLLIFSGDNPAVTYNLILLGINTFCRTSLMDESLKWRNIKASAQQTI